MDIAPYIQEYLSYNEQVSLPGFGRFIRRRMQGYFDQESGTLHPPRQRVEIVTENNPADDLVFFISEKKKISEAAARYFIDQFVHALKQKAAGGETELTGIGTISAAGDGYTLTSMHTFPESGFGLAPVSISEAKVQSLVVEKIPVKEAPEEAVIEEEDTSRTRIPTGVYVLFILVVFALSGGMTWYYHPEWFSPGKDVPAEKIPVKTAPPRAKPEKAVATVTDSVADTASTADGVKEEPTSTALPAAGADSVTANGDTLYQPKDFEIIGASFKTLSAAHEQVQRFGWKHVPAKMLKSVKGKRIRVSLGSFNDETAAQMELERLRAELKNKEIYIEPYNKR
ncbi:MAG: hypothetical protein INR69_01250 [Mucilaginibacter polytrichastri]|nr:hypothetical protein [Mucilaginibacter polytrichastri]